jgi:hypothetical protein
VDTPPPNEGLRALIVQPDAGGADLVRLPAGDLAAVAAIQAAIGGHFEVIGTSEWIAYVAEDERDFPEGLRPNLHADALARALGYSWPPHDFCKGVAVFLGRDGVEEVDVPQRVIDYARAAGLPVRSP